MIRYEAHTPAADSDELALRTHLVQEVCAVYDAMGCQNPEFVGDVAATVADVYRMDLGSNAVPENFLGLLVSHALWSTGDEAAARAMLCRHDFGRCGGDQILTSLFAAGRPSLTLCMLISVGLVRPSISTLSGSRPMWILHVDPLLECGDEALELAWTTLLRLVLCHLAQVWDASRGLGVLGVVQRREAADRSTYCTDVLAKCGGTRGWVSFPDVQNRSLHVRRSKPG